MKLSFVFLLAIIVTLSASYLAIDSFGFNVFAQPENSKSNQNNLSENPNNSKEKNFQNENVSFSSNTSSVIGNKDKEWIGRQNTQNPKIHPSITQILEHANPKAMAQVLGAELDGNSLTTYVYLTDSKKIPPGLGILAKDSNIIVSKLTLNQIQSISNLDSVRKITLPDYAQFYAIDESEGVEFSLADQLHLAGFNGSGITVAVIDDSFITSNSQISSNILSQWHTTGCANMACGHTDGSSHGTAVAEIVVDMAPEVNLRLYTVKNSVDFNNAVDYAIGNGTDIITASLGFPSLGGDGANVNDWYRDGTSTVAKRINIAKSSEILATIAAGNQGSSHWSGTYSPINSTDLSGAFQFDMQNGGYESVMMFNSTGTGNQRACLPINDMGSTYRAAWNAWPETSTEDYDLLLYASNMTTYLNLGSFTIQNPNGDRPYESFGSAPFGDACLVLASFSSSEDHLIHIDIGSSTFRNSTYMIPSGSIDTPADATGAFTVGAVSFNSTVTDYSDDFLENFSSQGPTDDSRIKPEICGPDRTFTHQTNLNPPAPGIFPGTSAATPHVAGAAALILQQNPSLTSDQLKQKLVDSARFDTDFSVDNKCGSGSGSLQLPLEASITIVKTANDGNSVFDFTTTATDTNLDGNFTGNGGFTINTSSSNSVKFTGLSPDVTYTITESSEPGWQFNSLSCTGGTTTSISGQSVTINPDGAAQITCTYTNTKITACTPPPSGTWTITSSCILNSNHTITGGNVIVQNNSVLEIPSGVTLDIDFANHNLTVKFGSGVLIKSGGKID